MPARHVYENWWHADAGPQISHYLQQHHHRIDTVFVAVGSIDPRAPAAEHERLNFLLPREVIQAATPLGIRVVTFGTMMEVLATVVPETGYVASKVALAKFVETHAAAGGTGATHIRIHTLYGGAPPELFMFAGQMLAALRAGTDFAMSPGTQLREYHHVDDDAAAAVALADAAIDGVIGLDHGDAMPLAELALATFSALGREDRLKIGALPAPAHERAGLRFEKSPLLGQQLFRDARVALPNFLGSLLTAPQALS